MKRLNRLIWIALGLQLGTGLMAQQNGRGTPPEVRPSMVDDRLPDDKSEANKKWLDLENETFGHGRALGWRNKADDAEKFYREFPDHPKAIAARRYEINALLEGDDGADLEVAGRLRDRVTSFRVDKKIPANERAQVVRGYELRQATARSHGVKDPNLMFEGVARGLKREFVDSDLGDQMLLSIADRRDNSRGLELAQELSRTATSKELREKAGNLSTRLGLVGKNLDEVLVGMSRSLKVEPGKFTIIYTWSTDDAHSLASARLLGGHNLKRANWIGVNLDPKETLEMAQKKAEEEKFPGTLIYSGAQAGSSIAKKLGLDAPGLVLLLDEEGKFFNVHAADDYVRILTSFGI